MVERGVIMAPSGTRIEVGLLPCGDQDARKFGLRLDGNIETDCRDTGKQQPCP